MGTAEGQQENQTRLLSITRGSLGSNQTTNAQAPSQDVRLILEAILAKLDGLADRPIDISVMTKLDGRQIARAVYKDMREQNVKNYETM